MRKIEKACLYWNTVKNLRPVQIRYQIGNRVRKYGKKRYPDRASKWQAPENRQGMKFLIPELDCDPHYLERFSIDGLMRGEAELLHETHSVMNGWNIPDASHLWNYNLQYLEFLIPLAVRYRQTGEEKYFYCWKRWMESWLAQSAGDSFEPYPISMRIPNLLVCMELLEEKLHGTELEKTLYASVYRQYGYLLYRQEKGLLANHYFENLKAIVISGLLFQESDVYHKYFDLLLKEIDEQILPDGLHFERSLMYHKIILEDLLRIHRALDSGKHTLDAEKLLPAIRLMASAMENLERGFRRTPLFNDAGDNVSKSKAPLLRAVEGLRKPGETVMRQFEASGYYRLDQGEAALLFDCGEIGPSYMCGHSHCDCLSFELAVSGKDLFVNSGTGQYQGKFRTFFRSTAAHNTVMIDDREQSELWGEHRAARRIGNVKVAVGEKNLTGQFRSYRKDLFQRNLKWINDKALVVTDDFKAHDARRHVARQFLHLAPGLRYEWDGRKIAVMEGKRLRAVVRLPEKCESQIHKEGLLTVYAEEFGLYQKKQVLEIRTPFQGKVRSRIEIRIMAAEK